MHGNLEDDRTTRLCFYLNFSLPLQPDNCSSSSHPTGARVRNYFQCNFWTRNPQIRLCGRIYAACIQSPSAYLLLPSCSPRRRWRREKKEIRLVMESMQFYDRLKMIIWGCQHGRVKTPEPKSLTLVTHRAADTIQYNAITYCCQNQSKTGRLKPPDMSITALSPLLCAYLMSSQPGPHHVSQTGYCPPSYNKTRSPIVRVQLRRRKLCFP